MIKVIDKDKILIKTKMSGMVKQRLLFNAFLFIFVIVKNFSIDYFISHFKNTIGLNKTSVNILMLKFNENDER